MANKDKNPEKRSWDWIELKYICHTRFYKQWLKRMRSRKRRQLDKKEQREWQDS